MQARGFVLVGGRSRRFGEDKAHHPVDGVPMALRVAASMAAAGLEVTLVGRGAGAGLDDLGLPVLGDGWEDEPHPLAGVVAALETCPLAVFAPCDLPWVPAEAFVALRDGPGARVATSDGRVHPLLAQLPDALLPRARALLREGRAARDLVAEATPVPLPADWLRNVNRPADLG